MGESHEGSAYPGKTTNVNRFPADIGILFPLPPGPLEDKWPPVQISYLVDYLKVIGCSTMVVESHYIDRDYSADVSAFYSRNLRGYPNHCKRVHFFGLDFDQTEWESMVTDAKGRQKSEARLREHYLGYAVIKPLPMARLGRTVLITLGSDCRDGHVRRFGAVHDYRVHLGGFELTVRGLPFQQQDQGVSACATVALWSSLHNVAGFEGMRPPTPAEITESASRYILAEGRSLPSEGLTIQQISEAVRAVGLAPSIVRSVDYDHDRAQLYGYITAGFAPVLLLQPPDEEKVGHAVCAVGVKLGDVDSPRNSDLSHCDGSTAVKGVYVHDDELGPYALAQVSPWTMRTGVLGTALLLRWPDKDVGPEQSQYVLRGMIVPTPVGLRMSIARIRALGMSLAEASVEALGEPKGPITLHCGYCRSTEYQRRAVEFGLSREGLLKLECSTVLSRFLGLIEVSTGREPLFDVLVDGTETSANPSALAFVLRRDLRSTEVGRVSLMAGMCGATFVS